MTAPASKLLDRLLDGASLSEDDAHALMLSLAEGEMPAALAGAFLAGLVIAGSTMRAEAIAATHPIQSVLVVVFFLSIGLLIDLDFIVANLGTVIFFVVAVLAVKTAVNVGLIRAVGQPWELAFPAGLMIAQIGEFSFILASMGVALAILPSEGKDLILAGALISIVLNPVVFFVLDLVKPRLEQRVARRKGVEPPPATETRMEPSMAAEGPATSDAPSEGAVDRGAPGADDDTGEPSHQTGHTVLVGYGQVGRIVAAGIKADGGRLVVIEDSDHDVAAARAEGFEVVFGNAASEDVLKLANLGAAKALLVAISNGFEAGSVCESGRKLNPEIAIISRAYSEEEESFLRNLGATTIIRGEQEIGRGILTYLRSDASGRGPGDDLPDDTKLPTAENILAKAAMGAALTEAALSEQGDDAEPAPEMAEAAKDDTNVSEDASEPDGMAADAAQLPVVEAVAVSSQEDGAEKAETEAQIEIPPAVVEPIVETASVGEAPPAIDEILPPQSTSGGAEEEVTAEPEADTGASEDPTRQEPEDDTPASPDAATAPGADDKETGDAAGADVPQVEPEKKD